MPKIHLKPKAMEKNSLFVICFSIFLSLTILSVNAQAKSKDDMGFGERNFTKVESMIDKDTKKAEKKTLDLLSRIDAFAEEDEQLRLDAAKAHYNIGNIYFQKGEYQIAAREYYQAVTLMPDDPDVHYNLAFVSGEHLKDYQTALKHYRIYLYLNPKAKDKHLVKEKVIYTELLLRSTVDSPLEKRMQ